MSSDEAEALRIAAREFYEASHVMRALLVTTLVFFGKPPADVAVQVQAWLNAGKELRVRLGLDEAPSIPNLPPIFTQVGRA